PRLIERPVVVDGDRAVVGRPPSNVPGLLCPRSPTSSRPATPARRWSTCGRRRARSCSSAGCGSRCCAPRASSASTCPTAWWPTTSRSSTTSTSTRSRHARRSPATTSRPASRSSTRWPGTSTCTRA
ncbi:hypothetical protein DF186_14150, partial [Enterococcus hirae]